MRTEERGQRPARSAGGRSRTAVSSAAFAPKFRYRALDTGEHLGPVVYVTVDHHRGEHLLETGGRAGQGLTVTCQTWGASPQPVVPRVR